MVANEESPKYHLERMQVARAALMKIPPEFKTLQEAQRPLALLVLGKKKISSSDMALRSGFGSKTSFPFLEHSILSDY